MPQTAPYGTWKSPITAEQIVSGALKFGGVQTEGNRLYWLEGRPQEQGRGVLVQREQNGRTSDITPPDYNVRTRVHEYGGGDFLVVEDLVYFSNFKDQRVYRQKIGNDPEAISPEGPFRYADYHWDPTKQRLICVQEDHHVPDQEATNRLVAFDFKSPHTPVPLVEGNDFYSSPRLNADGSVLAWIEWKHPNMPWDGVELWIADVQSNGFLGNRKKIAGGTEESIFQPTWGPDGFLYFTSDRSGWGNLYRWHSSSEAIEPLCPREADFSRPQWQFGDTNFVFLNSHTLLCTYTTKGSWKLGTVDLETRGLEEHPTPFTEISDLFVYQNGFGFLGSNPTTPRALVFGKMDSQHFGTLRASSQNVFDPGFLSIPESIEFPSAEERTTHAFYYAPKNKDFTAPEEQSPPLLVKMHSGPTTAASTAYSPDIQFWTSRGFAVLDINYGGSTGFGRPYMKLLEKRWGKVDVEDCVHGAEALVRKGLADPQRLAIRGGSAGGYTVLAALTFTDTFKAGASYYGIGDLEALLQDTHKFEARYMDRLVGPYPEEKETYRQRSPIHSVDQLSCPVIFLQGLEDKIVPPSQAEKMVEALKKKNIYVEYVSFEGEQHGFRKAENIKTALTRELAFYGKVFGF